MLSTPPIRLSPIRLQETCCIASLISLSSSVSMLLFAVAAVANSNDYDSVTIGATGSSSYDGVRGSSKLNDAARRGRAGLSYTHPFRVCNLSPENPASCEPGWAMLLTLLFLCRCTAEERVRAADAAGLA